jgi:cell division protein FtsQ
MLLFSASLLKKIFGPLLSLTSLCHNKKKSQKRRMVWRVLGMIFSTITLISGVHQVISFYKREIVHLTSTGFKNIDVVGQNRTNLTSFFWGLNMKKNDLIWTTSLSDIKRRLESLPWIQSATVQRRLPCTLRIDLKEYVPFAVWHHRGVQNVLDKDAHIIRGVQFNGLQHHELFHISGPEAAQNMVDLVCVLRDKPLFSKIRMAVFLRSGRWDLYLKDGRLIQCPEDNLRLALDRIHSFPELLNDAAVIDLRFDHVIFYRKKIGTRQQ